MLHNQFLRKATRPFLLAVLWILGSQFSARAGVDTYQIYLNDKLILQQSVLNPLSLSTLPITKANANDKLVIYYSQCNAPNKIGKGRSLVIKDASGNMVKEWKFTDSEGSSRMEIPVKELLALENKFASNTLTIYYTAQGMAKEQKLISLNSAAKSATYHNPGKVNAAVKTR